MINNPFQITSPPIAAMHGRRRDLARVLSLLQKEVPDHVSVIGPHLVGKTVLLNALGQQFAEGGDGFDGCLYWDIRHGLPAGDEQFLREFAAKLRSPIDRLDPDAAKLIQTEGGRFETIRIVFETLEDVGKRLMVILDGLDGVLLSADITKNLWDNLRSLAELGSIRFVTGSRSRLRELCASPDSKTSDFWNIFSDTPISVGELSNEDLAGFLENFRARGVTFERGADTELLNCCGGVPIVAAFVCKRLWDMIAEHQVVSAELVKKCCEQALEDGQDYWHEIWDDCSPEQKSFLVEVAQQGYLPEDVNNRKLSLGLLQRGILGVESRRIIFSCGIMHKFTKQVGVPSGEIRRLFGTREDFRRNSKALAEVRLGQLRSVDETLSDFVAVAVTNLEKPHVVVNQVRSFVNRALKLTWDAEIPDRNIPTAWTLKWQYGDMKPPEGRISDDIGQQCRLLNFMTGERKAAPTRIRRSTYLMLNALKGIGDFGQHQGTEQPGIGFGISVGLMLIEVLEQVMADLGSAPRA